MDLMDMFNEVLTTERRLSQEIYEQDEQKYKDNTLDISKMSYFVNPAYAKGQVSKPNVVSSDYRHKKSSSKKSGYLEELKHLLALSEIRYLNYANKLKSAIVSNKKLYYLKIVYFIRSAYPALRIIKSLTIRTYLYKWSCECIKPPPALKPPQIPDSLSNPDQPANPGLPFFARHLQLNEFPPPSRFQKPELADINSRKAWSELKEVKMKEHQIFRRFKLRSLFKILEKINKLYTFKAFFLFRERGLNRKTVINYYGYDFLSKRKLNNYIPHLKKQPTNKQILGALNLAESAQKDPRKLNRIKSYFN